MIPNSALLVGGVLLCIFIIICLAFYRHRLSASKLYDDIDNIRGQIVQQKLSANPNIGKNRIISSNDVPIENAESVPMETISMPQKVLSSIHSTIAMPDSMSVKALPDKKNTRERKAGNIKPNRSVDLPQSTAVYIPPYLDTRFGPTEQKGETHPKIQKEPYLPITVIKPIISADGASMEKSAPGKSAKPTSTDIPDSPKTDAIAALTRSLSTISSSKLSKKSSDALYSNISSTESNTSSFIKEKEGQNKDSPVNFPEDPLKKDKSRSTISGFQNPYANAVSAKHKIKFQHPIEDDQSPARAADAEVTILKVVDKRTQESKQESSSPISNSVNSNITSELSFGFSQVTEQEMTALYNNSIDEFMFRLHPVRVGWNEDGKDISRRNALRAPISLDDGDYWMIFRNADMRYVVPYPGLDFDDGVCRKLQHVFDLKGYRPGYRYSQIELLRPAIFSSGALMRKGAMNMEKGEPDVDLT
jgi:hypothetical protein